MKLLLAASRDGYLARGPDDDMRWTGPSDKAAFRLLSLSDGQPLLAGSRTFDQMPKLPGRELLRLSREPASFGKHPRLDLHVAAGCFPEAWLIGGPTVAEQALDRGLISRAFICVADVDLWSGMPLEPVSRYLPRKACHTVKLPGCTVKVYTTAAKWPAIGTVVPPWAG